MSIKGQTPQVDGYRDNSLGFRCNGWSGEPTTIFRSSSSSSSLAVISGPVYAALPFPPTAPPGAAAGGGLRLKDTPSVALAAMLGELCNTSAGSAGERGSAGDRGMNPSQLSVMLYLKPIRTEAVR